MVNWFKRMLAKMGLVSLAGGAGETDFATLQNDAVTFIAEKTLMVAHKAVRLYQLADKAQLPEGNSKTFQFTRYERLPLPNTPLSDGVTPGNTQMTISTVTAIAEQLKYPAALKELLNTWKPCFAW